MDHEQFSSVSISLRENPVLHLTHTGKSELETNQQQYFSHQHSQHCLHCTPHWVQKTDKNIELSPVKLKIAATSLPVCQYNLKVTLCTVHGQIAIVGLTANK